MFFFSKISRRELAPLVNVDFSVSFPLKVQNINTFQDVLDVGPYTISILLCNMSGLLEPFRTAIENQFLEIFGVVIVTTTGMFLLKQS